ncbi:MAG: AAA family ATPase [Saprospiraceae bacterium]|nr:AAA family ATPase [Lewinella sp.]
MNFILIVGPPAVGKMTVGQELAKLLDYRLFHNHYSIELALSLFSHGTDDFQAVNQGIRQLVFKTAAESKQLKGLIFTLVMDFDDPEDWDYLADIKSFFLPHNCHFYFVELYAPLGVRLARNSTPNRLEHKASKRNLQASERGVKEMEASFQMNTDGSGIGEEHYLWIDNSRLSPQETAERIIREFDLSDGEKIKP